MVGTVGSFRAALEKQLIINKEKSSISQPE